MARHLALVLATVLLASCGGTGGVTLPPGTTLDQHSEWTPIWSNELFGAGVPTVTEVREIAQTITVGRTGTLFGLDVRMGTDDGSTLTVRILPTAGGVPDSNDANALATWTYTPGTMPEQGSVWRLVVPGGLAVTSGQQIAVSVSYPSGRGGWVQSGQDTYAGGGIFERNPNVSATWASCCAGDLLFATYVGP